MTVNLLRENHSAGRLSMSTLDQLKAGDRARITSLESDEALQQRLLEMGLLEGAELEVLGFAPLGDPMEIRLGDYRLSLRKKEAAAIQVASIT